MWSPVLFDVLQAVRDMQASGCTECGNEEMCGVTGMHGVGHRHVTHPLFILSVGAKNFIDLGLRVHDGVGVHTDGGV